MKNNIRYRFDYIKKRCINSEKTDTYNINCTAKRFPFNFRMRQIDNIKFVIFVDKDQDKNKGFTLIGRDANNIKHSFFINFYSESELLKKIDFSACNRDTALIMESFLLTLNHLSVEIFKDTIASIYK